MRTQFKSASDLRAHQLAALRNLLGKVIPANPFYTQKFSAASPAVPESLEDFSTRFPFTLKSELAETQQAEPPYGTNLTFPLENYTRYHQTSGTSGVPLRWLDTPESWSLLIEQWEEVYAAANVNATDRIFFAFSFGPFIGFWLAFEAAEKLGALCLPGGGLSTSARLQLILDNHATVLCCTPTYAIHLGEAAGAEKIDLAKSAVRLIIVAGEPGGSIPATRAHIEKLWPGARAFDHHGMTETGPVTYECPAHPCRLHVVEWAYFPEVIDPASSKPTPIGATGELLLTNFTRAGSPLIRYRTGDLVRFAEHHRNGRPCECGRWDAALEGGIIGRADDMVVIRGVNIYPTAVEQIIRGFSEIAEYEVQVRKRGALTEMHVTIEPIGVARGAGLARDLEKAFEAAFSMRVPVAIAISGSLPRSELKARRWSISEY
jgi:phenylacetate-CoA ligase